MPSIILSDSVFNRLKGIAEPFVDTPESVIERLILAEVQRKGKSGAIGDSPLIGGEIRGDMLQINPDSHESLAFTRVLSATLDGRPIHRPKWNNILDQIHILAFKRLKSFDAVNRITSARIRRGRYEHEGFSYLAEVDLSIQGVDANNAWDHSLRIARVLPANLKVDFEWRNHKKAAHPGKRGELHS